MFRITVVNKYKVANNIYCGRGSALGNMFPMYSESDRDKVCDQYEDWFYTVVDEPNFINMVDSSNLNPQMRQLTRIFKSALIGDINLGCFCAPRRCHCDTIKHFIELKIKESLK